VTRKTRSDYFIEVLKLLRETEISENNKGRKQYRDKENYERVSELEKFANTMGLGQIGRGTIRPLSRLDKEQAGLGTSLCMRCTNGVVFRRTGSVHLQTHCQAASEWVPSDISECSKFNDANQMSLDDFASIGIPIDPREGPPSADKGYL